MKKTWRCIILSILFCFSLIPSTAFALDKPEIPDVEGLSIVEANELIKQYNVKALEYNTWVETENQKEADDYAARVEEVSAWNAAEKQKVEDNRAILQEQYELQKLIAADYNKAIVNRTEKESDLPQSADGLDPEASALWETTGTFSGQPYNFLCRYIYLDDNDNYLLGEWVVGQASPTETVKIYSEGPVFYNGTYKFNRKIEGYTNGYWVTSETIVDGNCDELNSNATQITLKNSDIDTGITATFYYKFMRTSEDPELVELYEPQYMSGAAKPTVYEPVEYLKLQVKDIDTIEVVPTDPSDIPIPPEPIPGLGDPITIIGILGGIAILAMTVIIIVIWKRKKDK